MLLACLLFAVALACKKKKEPSPETVAKAAELKPKVTEALARIARLSAKTKSETGSGTGFSEKPWPVKIAVTGEKFLEDPHRTTEAAELDLGDPMLSVCKYIVDATQIKDDDIKSLETCAQFEYVAVIREQSFSPPEAEDGRSYTPGSFSGDVLVYHLATGELRANKSVSVTQSDQLELTSERGQKPAAHEWRKQAMAFMKNHVRKAALDAL